MKPVLESVAGFHGPLQPGDSEIQTLGCRHTNPDICAKHSMLSICAFVRADQLCLSPSASWPKQFRKLLARASAKNEGRT